MADLQRKTANLFNKATVTADKGVDNSTGELYNATTSAASDWIDVSGLSKVTISNTAASRYGAFYDSTKTYISGFATFGTKNVPARAKYMRVTVRNESLDTFMVVDGETLPTDYVPYGWVHSLRKLTTATEAVENPLYSDGTAITAYTIKGNTVQSGTPTPSNPVEVQGVGNKTANLLDVTLFHNGYHINSQGNIETFTGRIATTTPIDVSNYTSVTFSYTTTRDNDNFIYATFSGNTLVERVAGKTSGFTIDTTNCNKLYLCLYNLSSQVSTADIITAMLNGGSTALDYEPYGYKIPISSAQGTTNIYLNEPLYKINDTVDTEVSSGTATYAIKKYEITGQEYWTDVRVPRSDTYLYMFSPSGIIDVGNVVEVDVVCTHFVCGSYYSGNTEGLQHSQARLYFRTTETTLENWKTWLSDQYAAGTPVTVWYILTTPTTETITAPSIPTTEGANSITVDTTVQPSEFTATWTGWHNAAVKEWDSSQWN